MTRTALTETKIKQLKPKSKPYKVSDGTIGGLHVAVSTAGGKVFCLAYRFEDKWRLLRLGASANLKACSLLTSKMNDIIFAMTENNNRGFNYAKCTGQS